MIERVRTFSWNTAFLDPCSCAYAKRWNGIEASILSFLWTGSSCLVRHRARARAHTPHVHTSVLLDKLCVIGLSSRSYNKMTTYMQVHTYYIVLYIQVVRSNAACLTSDDVDMITELIAVQGITCPDKQALCVTRHLGQVRNPLDVTVYVSLLYCCFSMAPCMMCAHSCILICSMIYMDPCRIRALKLSSNARPVVFSQFPDSGAIKAFQLSQLVGTCNSSWR